MAMSGPVLIPDVDEELMAASNPPSGRILAPPTQFQRALMYNDRAVALKRDREREGRCAECGIQTHSFRNDAMHGVPLKEPLTIDNEVYRGRCLFCFPLRYMECTNQSPSIVQEHHSSCSVPVLTVGCAQNRHSIETKCQIPRRPVVCDLGDDSAELDSADIVDTLYMMRQYPWHEVVQEWGCERLWVHSWEDEASFAIGRIGGIHNVLDAMSRFPRNVHLQRCACEALQNLALGPYNRSLIVDAGGAALIVQAMMLHFDSLSIQQCGCVALASLASSRQLHEDIIRAGGAHAIIHAARRYIREESICSGASQALEALGIERDRYLPELRG